MIVLDTNVISELMRPEPSAAVVRWMGARPLAAMYITSLTQAEILLGIELMPEGRRRQQLAEQARGLFAEGFAGRIIAFDSVAAPAYAAIVRPATASGPALGRGGRHDRRHRPRPRRDRGDARQRPGRLRGAPHQPVAGRMTGHAGG